MEPQSLGLGYDRLGSGIKFKVCRNRWMIEYDLWSQKILETASLRDLTHMRRVHVRVQRS